MDPRQEAAKSLIESGEFERIDENTLKLTTYGADDMMRMVGAFNYLGISPQYNEDSFLIKGFVNIDKLERAGLDLENGNSRFNDPNSNTRDGRSGYER